MKKHVASLVQLAIGIGLIVFIFAGMQNRGDMLEALRAGAQRWPLIVAGVAMFFVCLLCCIVRWKWLLDARGMALPFRRVFTLYFVGQFFNAFMFGATGGDVVKAWFVSRELHTQKTEAISTVVLDRIIGILALIALTITMMILRMPFYLAHPETRLAMVFNVGILGAAVVFLVLIFGRNWLENWAFFRRLEARTVLGRIVMRAYTTCHGCMRDRVLLAKTLAVSLLNHLALIVATALLGQGLGIRLPFVDYLTIFPVINMIAAIPVTPGGLGTRETAAKVLLGVMGVPATRAVPLSLLIYAMMLFWSLVGGIVYLGYVSRTGMRPPTPANLDPELP